MHPTQQTENKVAFTRIILVIVLFFATLPQINADMYVPSLPYMAKELHSDNSLIQLTLSIYLFGFSLSHLIYGPISDRIGRRKPLLFGIGLGAIGSLICLCAFSVNFLLFGRLIQGVGLGACNSVGRSISRDLLTGAHIARLSSHVGMITTFIIAASPTLGGYIQHYFDWRANFLALFLLTAFAWILIFKKLPETNFKLNPSATQFKVAIKNYWFLLTNKTFVGYSLTCGLAYAGILAYITAAPFLFQSVLGLTAIEYGWLSFIIALSIFITSFINGRYVVSQGIQKMILFGMIIMLLGSISMLVLALEGIITFYSIMIPVAIFCMGGGLTFSNAFAGAIHPFPHMAGSAGAMYGCIQILCGSIASAIISASHDTNQIPLSVVLTCLSVFSFAAWRFLACAKVKS
jgi:DHA1 family 2-module integral membrane pump EmrD-like MFS transporter